MNARTQILRPIVGAAVTLLTAFLGSQPATAQVALGDVVVVSEVSPFTSNINMGVASADLNGDTIADLIALNGPDNSFVALGSAASLFADRIPFPSAPSGNPTSRYNVAFIDLDRDMHLDAFINGRGFLNDGTGAFGPSIDPPFSDNHFVRTADMNADSFLDVIAGRFEVEIYLSTGPMTFGEAIEVPALAHLHAVARVSDDNVPDILDEDEIMISTAEAGVGTVYPVGDGSSALVDLNGDSLAEVVKVAWPGPSTRFPEIRVLKFNGNGFDVVQSFKLPLGFPTNDVFVDFDIVPLDHDNDGDLDLAVAPVRTRDEFAGIGVTSTQVDSGVLILDNDGKGVLSIGRTVSSGGLIPISVAAGDFDGSPGDDLVTANTGMTIILTATGEARLFGRTISLVHTDAEPNHAPQQLAQGSVGSGAISGAVFADVNEDAIPDFVAVQNGDLQVRLATSPGVFDNTPVFVPSSLDHFDPIVADANGDSVPDALVRRGAGTSSHAYLRVSPEPLIVPGYPFVTGVEMNFLAPTTATIFDVPGRVAVLDLDNDADEDIVSFTTSPISQNFSHIRVGLFDGTAYPTTLTLITGRIRRLEMIQANADSAPDIAIYKSADPRDPGCLCWHDWRIEIYLNDGSGHFSADNFITIEQTTDEVSGLVVADFGGDSRDDIVASTLGAEVRLYVHSDTGFGNPIIRNTAPLSMLQPAVADFDLDGELDIASPVYVGPSPVDLFDIDEQSLFLYSSRAHGFNRESRLAHYGGIPGIPLTGDVDLDGRADYIMAGTVGGATIYPNASIPPPKCVADANGDDVVDGRDLSVLLAQFGEAVAPGTGADFNDDGVVNGLDLSVLLAQFGSSCQ